jgi:hypothetical protein
MPLPARWAPQLPLPRISRCESCASPAGRYQSPSRRHTATQPNPSTPHADTFHGSPSLSCAARSSHGSRCAPMLSLNTAAACSEGINSDNDNDNFTNVY